MGIVTDYLRNVIAKQVDDHSLVLWFDPEKHYADTIKEIAIPNTAVERYEGSFFALRNGIEPRTGRFETAAPACLCAVGSR